MKASQGLSQLKTVVTVEEYRAFTTLLRMYLHGRSDIKQWVSKQATRSVVSITTTWHPRAWSKTMGIVVLAVVVNNIEKLIFTTCSGQVKA